MNDRAWEELIDLIDTKYTIDDSNRLEEKLEDNPGFSKKIERIEFEKDNIKYRIDRVTSPAIVDKKTHYHHKGSADRIQFVYDPTETTSKIVFYQMLADGHFNEISPESMLS
ncbi:hypothetical protein H0W80_00515 [Candidatus Saccharibacteria bacterium]|nr:hypothetical protein [Candidatus Saccharibacteria bacterium]